MSLDQTEHPSEINKNLHLADLLERLHQTQGHVEEIIDTSDLCAFRTEESKMLQIKNGRLVVLEAFLRDYEKRVVHAGSPQELEDVCQEYASFLLHLCDNILSHATTNREYHKAVVLAGKAITGTRGGIWEK